jgi:putative SOS response-associated peptidase YedK
MPLILTTPEEADLWLSADTADELTLQRPLPEYALRIVAKGEKEDRGPDVVEEADGDPQRAPSMSGIACRSVAC